MAGSKRLRVFRGYLDGGLSKVFIADADQNYANNFGGVSLRITAVPEPSTWALAIMGFGMAGAMLRRRKAALAV